MKKAVRWILMCLLGLFGLASFVLLACDEDPGSQLRLGEFLLVKFTGVAGMASCYFAGKALYKAGLLPDEFDEEI